VPVGSWLPFGDADDGGVRGARRVPVWERHGARTDTDPVADPGRMPVLRMPGRHDPAPDPRRMATVCAWAAALGVIGLAVAGRAMVALMAGGSPDWYEPTVVAVGVAGMALTATAYLAVHRTRLPFALLGAATVPLGANMLVTVLAL
jgi:hypothetical protein